MPVSPATCKLLARIEVRIAALRINASRASLAAGLSRDAIRNMRRSVKKNRAHSPSLDTIIALTEPLQCSIAFLVGIEDDPGTQ